MTPAQAAKLIGCSAGYVRLRCQQGTIKAKLVLKNVGGDGSEYWQYDISPAQVQKFAAGYPYMRGPKCHQSLRRS